jgi:predicted DNA-binding transcriptional regulator YafY
MWYLYATRVGAAGKPDALRMYSLPRIRRVSFLDSTFEQPDADKLKQRFKHRIGIIDDGPDAAQRVRFEAKGWARRIIDERHWGGTLKRVSTKADRAVYELWLSRPEEFERWLLSLGADVRVLEPSVLADRIQDVHRRAADADGW